MPLKNPYPDPPPGAKNHKVSADVSPLDYQFLKSRYPFLTGLTDIVISILYKKLLDELRSIDTQLRDEGFTDGIEPAWFVTSPVHALLNSILDGTNFGERERHIGLLRPRDVGPATSGLREEGGGAPIERSDKKSDISSGRDKAGRKKKTKEKG